MGRTVLSKSKAKDLERIREKAKEVLFPPVHFLNYTDHSISHSDRVIEIIEKILEPQNTTLSEDEVFILYAASYLHDIGMQIPESKLLEYPHLDDLLNKSKMTNQDIQNDREKLTLFIREWHHYFSEYMIIKSTDWNNFDLGLKCLHPAQIRKIALVAKGHRKVDLYNQDFSYREPERLQLLAALLRLSDAIDCDKRRVDLSKLGILDLSLENKMYWFFHYCVEKVEIKDHFLQIHAIIPKDDNNIWNKMFKSIFIYTLWKDYFNVLDILREYRIVLVWAPSKVIVDDIMNPILQRFDHTGQLKKHIIQKSVNIWKDTSIFNIINVLGKTEKLELEISPYYFTGIEEFKGIQIRQWPKGVYACSYRIFSDAKTLEGPIIIRETQELINLPPPDFKLEEGKKYRFELYFYHKEDIVLFSQNGIFWLIERNMLEKKKEMLKHISDLSAEQRNVYLGLITESIGAYEEAIKIYLQLVDNPEWKRYVIQRLVIIFEKIFNELDRLGWINERDQVRRHLIYWARLFEK